MRTSTPTRLVASIMLAGLVMSACGQKPGVRVGDDGLAAPAAVGAPVQGGTGTTPDAGGAPATSGTTDPATGGTTDGAAVTGDGGATTDQTTTGGGEQATTGGGEQNTGSTSQPTTNTNSNTSTNTNTNTNNNTSTNNNTNTQQPQQPSGQVIGNDRTGAGPDRITIGLHAPATGAAPLPTESFETAKDTYWKWTIGNDGPILGRERIDVLFSDDKYDPNSAGTVCQQLAAEAFLVAGGGGTDQIQRCGQLASVQKYPYFSAGVTEAGLTGNPWYFASSMSYRQQGSLLAQYVAKNPDNIDGLGPGAKIGTIITDTDNFDDAEAGWLQGLADNGLTNIGDVVRHTKGDTSFIGPTVRQFQEDGVEVVYFLSAPTVYLDFANKADQQFGYNPLYVGVGVSKGLNAVLRGGCKAPGSRDDNGIFLSPFPGLDWAEQNLPEFFTASQQTGAPADDIALALWGSNQGFHDLLKKYEAVYGNDLERETFRAFVETQTIETDVNPTVAFQPNNHFGASSAWVLHADCSQKKYVTAPSVFSGPASGF